MKNQTKIDINVQMELVKITFKKVKVIFAIMGLLLIIAGIIVFENNDAAGIVFIVGGFALIVIFVLFWNKLIMNQLRKNILLKGEIYNLYEFNEDFFLINTIRDEESIGNSKLKYSDFTKVLENKNYIFLFLSNTQSYVLSKNDMTEGKVEDLILFIKSKIPNYKIVE